MSVVELKKKLEGTVLKMLYHIGAGKMASNYVYKRSYHKNIKWEHPQTLNEKLMVLKHTVYWKNPLISNLADKYGMRKYVQEVGCGELLTELLLNEVYEKPEDIVWENLPNKFALKCTHGCKMNIIVDDKSAVNREEILLQLRQWQKEKFGYRTGEWHYLSIEPRIICEKYYGAEDKSYPTDYKIFCLNGKPVCIEVCTNRKKGTTIIFMDMDWNRIYIDSRSLPDRYIVSRPANLKKMKEYAERLSAPFPFVRVDFYEVERKLLLSELTFTPACNVITSITDEGQKILGNKLVI